MNAKPLQEVLKYSSIGFAHLELITDVQNRNRDFRFLDSNPALEKITGLKKEKITGKTVRELFASSEAGCYGWTSLCERIALTDEAAEFEHYFEASGKWYQVHVHFTDKLFVILLFVDITGPKKSEVLLQINEKDLRESQRISQVGSWRLDINTNQVTWTEELYKMYGFDPSLPPPPYTEHMKLFTAESWERLSKALANTRETGIPYTLELETVRKDGSNGWMWVHGEADVDQAGKILSLWGAAQDITRRKKAEAQLIETEQRLRLANRATRDVIWDWDIETDTQRWNEAGKLIFGWTEIVDGPVNAQWWVERVHTEDRQRVHDSFFKVVNDPQLEIWNDEYRFQKSDGSYANVLDRGYVLRNQEGKASRMIGAMLDITGRKRVEDDLKRSEHVLRLFVEHSPAAIAMFDSKMCYMITSQRYLSDYRLEKQDLAGLSHYDVFPEMTDVHKNIHRRCLEGFIEKNNEDFLHRHDGTIDWVKWELRPWYEDNGEIGGLIFFSEVITEQKNAADEIRWLNEDLQLINAVTAAANQGKDFETIVNIMASYLKAYFNTHLISLFFPNTTTGNLEMYGNTLDPELVQKIERIIRRPIPRVSLNPKTIHPFVDIAETGMGILSVGKSEVIQRLEGYLRGTSWPAIVQNFVNSLLPLLYDILQYQSTAAVAMKVEEEIIGFVEIGSKNTMSLRDLERIQSYADHLATVFAKLEAEKKRKQSEERMSIAFNHASIGMVIVSPQGRIQRANPSMVNILGFTEKELLGKTAMEISHPEDLKKDRIYINQMLEGIINNYQTEKRYIHKTGKVVWAILSITLVRDTEGKSLYFISQVQDITERKINEEKIKESDNRFRRIFESVQDVYFEASMDGTLLEVSPSIEKIAKGLYSRDEMIGNSFVEVYADPLARDLYFAKLMEQKSVSDYELWLKNKDGSIFPVTVSSVITFDEMGKPERIAGIMRDISERKKSENELKEALENLHQLNLSLEKRVEERTREVLEITGLQKAILKNAPLAILTSDPEGIFQSINPAGEKMLGYTANEIIGMQNPLIFHDMPEMIEFCRGITGNSHPSEDEIYQTALQHMFQKTTEWTWVRKNGEKFPVRITHSRIVDDNGVLLGFMGLIIDISEERKAIEALRESEEGFQHLFLDHAAVMLLINPETGEIIGANKSAERFYGFSFDAPIRRNISDINALTTESVNKELIRASNRDQNTFIFPHRLNSGETRMVEVHSTPIEVKGSRILFSIIHDITDRMVAESALKKSEAENRAIIQAVPDLMFRISRDGTYLDAHCQNDSSLYAPKEVFIGKKIIEILPPDLAEKSMNSIRKAFSTDEVVQYEYKLEIKEKDYYFENRMIAISADEVLSIIRDITDRKESEAALQMQSAAFESFSLAIIITDKNGAIQWANSAFANLTGYSLEEAKGKTPGQLVKSGMQDKIFYQSLWNTILGKKVWTGELINRKKDGTLYYEESSITPVMNPHGEIENFISIKIDITDRKKAQEELLKAKEEAEKANKAKSMFLSRMSHELRTPMNSILGFAQLLEMGELNQKQKKGVTHILNNGKHLLDLINEVLDISGIEAGRQTLLKEPIALPLLINEVIDSLQGLAGKKMVSIIFEGSSSEKVTVLADRVRLRQILINLIGNAIKYNVEGGTVSVLTEIDAGNDNCNRHVKIKVTDTGTGIKAEDISKLFQPFERIGADKTNIEGTGLGLMVVKRLTEAMGGTVGVESTLGKGSTFWVELPAGKESNQASVKIIESKHPEFEHNEYSSSILYVEDNLSNIELVNDILSEHRPGINLFTTSLGFEATDLARKHQPALILLDLDLPDIQGIEVLEQVLNNVTTKSIPIIVVSADAMPHQIEKLIHAGAKEYLTKPLDIIKFLQVIDIYTNAKLLNNKTD